MKYGLNSQRIKLFEEFITAHYLHYYIIYATLCASMTRDMNLKVSKCNDRLFQGMKVTLLMREYSKETETSESAEEIDNHQQKQSYPMRSLLNTYIDNNTEFIYFSNEYKCNKCSKTSQFTQADKFKIPPQDEKGFKCPLCSNQFTPQVTIQISEDAFETINIITPLQLFQTLYKHYMTINSYKIDIDKFKHNHPNLFWNLVFYFDYQELPFDFLIPYGKGKQMENKSENDNKNYEFSELVMSSNTLAYEYNYEPISQSIEPNNKIISSLIKERRNSTENKHSISKVKDMILSNEGSKKRSLTIKNNKSKKLVSYNSCLKYF